MKICRFIYNRKIKWGIIEKHRIKVLEKSPFRSLKIQTEILFKKVKLLAPVEPSKIVLVGLNYRDHAEELGMEISDEPIIFLKPPSSVIGPDEDIIYPPGIGRIDYEAELAVVIKKKCKHIRQQEADDFILGYTCLNDITARDIQKKDGQWTRAKSFDTFCPIGPWIETHIDPENLRIRCYLNGDIRQDSATSNFIFPVSYLISFISRVMTLLPGDVISIGTPPGVGEMVPGDRVEVDIEGIGVLRNRVVRI
jgi:2-keto-4-pentenoate hydratase/2-oxohepta-3-ene-1,7-dioic acid hydratase in catechol pathway